MVLLIIAFVFLFVGVLFHFLTKRFVNPYKLYFVFGKKGSGKSTLLSKLTYRYCKNGWTVYSTEVSVPTYYDKKWVQIDDADEAAYIVKPIEPREIYKYQFPENSCILIDEVSLIWDNRNFKSMDPKVIEWFRYQRHHKCVCYLFSQVFDIDLKLRNLTDVFFMVNKTLRVFVVAKRINRKLMVVHPSPEAPARIDEDMIVENFLLTLFGSRIFCYIPYWAKKFDSYK